MQPNPRKEPSAIIDPCIIPASFVCWYCNYDNNSLWKQPLSWKENHEAQQRRKEGRIEQVKKNVPFYELHKPCFNGSDNNFGS